jgi:nucleoside-diphosphate-sugar epimerase
MKIAILGANGFIGSKITSTLSKFYDVTPITRDNYSEHTGKKFDVFINANGNSRRFWAEQNPKEDFIASVASVNTTLFDFTFDRYVYLSSLDAMRFSIYGVNKSVAEKLLYYNSNRMGFELVVLRLGAVIGKDMKKGVLYDILNGNNLRISPKSKMQFITDDEVVRVVAKVMFSDNEFLLSFPLNICGTTSISVSHIIDLAGKDGVRVSDGLETHVYDYPAHELEGVFELKTSQQYIKECMIGGKNV